jgi:hypothetical protein
MRSCDAWRQLQHDDLTDQDNVVLGGGQSMIGVEAFLTRSVR